MFNQATQEFGAVNLGQGFMNFPAPDFVKQAAKQCVVSDHCTQYSPPRGRPRLKKALADTYSPSMGRTLDPQSEILITAGGNEGMLSVFASFLEKDSEVILMEPAFDQYAPDVIMMGGKPIYVPLRISQNINPSESFDSSLWKLNMDELKSKITPRTKILVLNTPHNPVGKVFSKEELIELGEIAKEHNLLILADEVYDMLVYPPHEHLKIATLPGLWERTITVGSAGKAFGVTGWRIGWLVGPSNLISPCANAHTRIVFCVNSPLQEAVAICFEEAQKNGFFEKQTAEYDRRRAKLMKSFDSVGLAYTIPQGSYFLLVNASKVKIPDDYQFPQHIVEKGYNFKLCYFFTKEIGVTGIPPSEFFSDENRHLVDNYVRFAFCKTWDVLEEAEKRLLKVKQFIV